MLIRVMYDNNNFDMVRPEMLDLLLEQGVISSFLRCDGWVMPGSDPLRRKSRSRYSGPDRRNRRELDRRDSL